MRHQEVDEYLLELQLITQEHADNIHARLKDPENANKRFEELAVELGYISEVTLLKSLAAKYRIPYTDLSTIVINPEAVKKIPEDIARKYTIIAVTIQGRRLYVAAAEPLDSGVPGLLESLTSMDIIPLITSKSAIIQAIDNMY